MDLLTPVQECLVLLTVNGLKTVPRKAICEIEGETKKAWIEVLKPIEYMHLRPLRQIFMFKSF